MLIVWCFLLGPKPYHLCLPGLFIFAQKSVRVGWPLEQTVRSPRHSPPTFHKNVPMEGHHRKATESRNEQRERCDNNCHKHQSKAFTVTTAPCVVVGRNVVLVDLVW